MRRPAVIVLSMMLIASILPAAPLTRQWDELARTIEKGRTVVVTRLNAEPVEGRLLGINAESITVRWKGHEEVVPRLDVRRVRYANIRRKHTLLGLGIGAAGGAIIGAASMRDTSVSPAAGAAGMAILGLGLGALVGGVLPIGPPLYEPEPPARQKVR